MQRTSVQIYSGILFTFLAASRSAIALGSEIPGWFLAGSAVEKYRITLASRAAYNGTHSARLASLANAPKLEFGTLMQKIDARKFGGKRIRFSAYIRTVDVIKGAALWMRVDGGDGTTLAFDNMSHRGWIIGDSTWTSYSVVLDVPGEARAVSFGVLLSGTGQVWIDDVALEPVSLRDPVTAIPIPVWSSGFRPGDLPPLPMNLNFEDEPDIVSANP